MTVFNFGGVVGLGGVKYASTHDLRRTFAQRLADSALPPELVRRLMRHADIKTTERFYLQTNT